MTSPQAHDDPLGEARGQLLQALAVLATVGEAAARYAVSGIHNRSARAEHSSQTTSHAAGAEQQADRLDVAARTEVDKAARRLIGKAFNETWLSRATVFETAELWRTAAVYASTGNRRAGDAMRLAEGQLRRLNPLLMDAYAPHRAEGMNLAEAMHAAAYDVWRYESRTRARSHGATGDPAPALRTSAKAIADRTDRGLTVAVAELDDAARAEVALLADGVDPDLLDRWQRQRRSTGHASSADAASVLSAAARELRTAAQFSGPITGIARVRRGMNHPSDQLRPPTQIGYDDVEVPIRSLLAASQLAADGLDRTANEIRGRLAQAAHLAGLAQGNARSADVDAGVPDMGYTATDEHLDGLAVSRLHRASAAQQQALADQQTRLAHAFRPLTRVDPTYQPAPTPGGPATPAKRRGQPR